MQVITSIFSQKNCLRLICRCREIARDDDSFARARPSDDRGLRSGIVDVCNRELHNRSWAKRRSWWRGIPNSLRTGGCYRRLRRLRHTRDHSHSPSLRGQKKGGTYGRPWAGSEVEGATLHKPRCKPGSILTILHVFWDQTPLISKLGFTCYDAASRTNNDILPSFGGTSVKDIRLICDKGPVGIGIFGRAGTAIDALGLTCGDVLPPPHR